MSTLPLLRRVMTAMETIAPLALAESWDNVGLLLEHPNSTTPNPTHRKVLLTIDLTEKVLAEAVQKEVNVIVAYHPPIFAGMKRITLADAHQRVIMNAAAHGMSIFSPHSSLDACVGGMCDWLCDAVGAGSVVPITPMMANGKPPRNDQERRETVTGSGRVLTLASAITLGEAVARVKKALRLDFVRVATPANAHNAEMAVATVATCAGSGTGCFKHLAAPVDLLLTGEMSHHDVLAYNHRGTAVILCEHTNSERGYLRDRLQPRMAALLGADVEVLVAETDADPLRVW